MYDIIVDYFNITGRPISTMTVNEYITFLSSAARLNTETGTTILKATATEQTTSSIEKNTAGVLTKISDNDRNSAESTWKHVADTLKTDIDRQINSKQNVQDKKTDEKNPNNIMSILRSVKG
jgi:hypothetical protein